MEKNTITNDCSKVSLGDMCKPEATESEHCGTENNFDEDKDGKDTETFEEAVESVSDNDDGKRSDEHEDEGGNEEGGNDRNDEDGDRWSDEDDNTYASADEGEVKEEELIEEEKKLSPAEIEERRTEAVASKEEGNTLFKKQSYEEAIKCYTRALNRCPHSCTTERATLYNNRAVCKMKLGKNKESIRDCTKAVELNPQYLKAILRRAELQEKEDRLDEALKDYQRVVELDPSVHSARAACMRLPEQINDRNEKLKEEMMGKLKDLGNLVLRPFGLSTNNFQLNKDPNTGGYSINFQQNPPQS